MLGMLAVDILVGSIRMAAEGIVAEGMVADGMVAGGRRTKNCGFVDNPFLDLNHDKTKGHPMEHCMMEHCMRS